MKENKIYVDTIGLPIVIDMGENISPAEDIVLNVKLPDGQVTTWTPVIINPVNNNQLLFITAIDTLALSGEYVLQPGLKLGDWIGLFRSVSFRVYKKYAI